MPSPLVDRAIGDAFGYGSALLKVISPNDVGLTGGHQKGYYLPKSQWVVFTPQEPIKGINHDHQVEVVWQDGQITKSTIKWYGKGTRSEYRLTGFNRQRDFPFIQPDMVGGLLVLVPVDGQTFFAYVFDLEEEILDFEVALGVDTSQSSWALFNKSSTPEREREADDACLDRKFRDFAASLDEFPTTKVLSGQTYDTLRDCLKNFSSRTSDFKLLEAVTAEYQLFRMIERKICEPDVVRLFRSIDDFLGTAQSITQRRKARAGRSLELHVEQVLLEAEIPFDSQASVDGTKPDLVIPGKRQYDDLTYPIDRLFVVGIKTTCRDRWRQVLREAPRVRNKHILTTQQGISPGQMTEMRESGVTVVVPSDLHSKYDKTGRVQLLTVEDFIGQVRQALD